MASARTDVSRAQLTTLSAAYKDSWSVNGGLNLASLKFTTETLYRGPDFKDLPPIDPGSWIDLSYIKNTLRTVGIDRSADLPA
jgi:NitT/TauT family transport system substrate-binding protein